MAELWSLPCRENGRLAAIIKQRGIEVLGLEIADQLKSYAWQKSEPCKEFQRTTLFTEKDYEQVIRKPVLLARTIWHGLSEIEPDILAVNGYSTLDAWIVFLWGRSHSRKLILMFETNQNDAERTYLKETTKKVLLTQFDAAICGGSQHKEYLISLGMPQDQIFTGYDAVDNDFWANSVERAQAQPEAFRNLPGLEDFSRPYFLTSARFLARKNITGLLFAYKLYKNQMKADLEKPWRLVIIGDGEQKDMILSTIRENQLQGDVTLAGFHSADEIAAYYAFAEVFVHPALQDQWGLVVNEAMASGLPVFVSKMSGCAKDLVQNGVNGYIFDASDPELLAALMLKAANGAMDLRRMGCRSRQIIAAWGLEGFTQGMNGAVQKAWG